MSERVRWKGDMENIDFAVYRLDHIGAIGSCECGAPIIGEDCTVDKTTVRDFGVCFACNEGREIPSPIERAADELTQAINRNWLRNVSDMGDE